MGVSYTGAVYSGYHSTDRKIIPILFSDKLNRKNAQYLSVQILTMYFSIHSIKIV